jgi:alpha-beta hydrolase superfamily lysophospholipase
VPWLECSISDIMALKSFLHSPSFPVIGFVGSILFISYQRAQKKICEQDNSTKPDCDREENSSEALYKRLGFADERFTEDLFLTCRGNEVVGPHKIRVVSWLPPGEPIGVVLISHGLHEHALRYYSVAHALAAKGVAVYACDHYAHGKSDGTRGLLLDHNILVSDFVEFGEWIHSKHPALPVSLLSHSMGTLVAMLSLNSLPFLSSVVFSATPLFSGPSASSPFGLKFLYPITQTSFVFTLTKFLASVDPAGPSAPILLEGISSSIDEQNLLLGDTLRYGEPIRNITAREVMTMVQRCKDTLSTLTLPFFCMHGEEDSIGLPKGTFYLIDNTPGVALTHKRYTIYPKLRHEIFHETPEQSERCIGDAVKYLLRTLNL